MLLFGWYTIGLTFLLFQVYYALLKQRGLVV